MSPLYGESKRLPDSFRSLCKPGPPKPPATPPPAANLLAHLNGRPTVNVGRIGWYPRLEQRQHLIHAAPGGGGRQQVGRGLHAAGNTNTLARFLPPSAARPSLWPPARPSASLRSALADSSCRVLLPPPQSHCVLRGGAFHSEQAANATPLQSPRCHV